ncbi:hypothetical protein AMS60_05635 [Bacillus sp. FJAT-21945]|nr:hypothetical protein AMS60_05635 [Bacillus sp. FJAT-21945]
MFDDKKASDAYMKMIDKVAGDSPVLNSTDMFSSSKALISLTKSVDQLEKAWLVAEKLNVMDPTQGVDGAVFAMKELATGDVLSLTERFGLSKKELHKIKTLPFEKQLTELERILKQMNITDKVVERMGGTTLSQWNKMQEMSDMTFRRMGESANSHIGAALTRINTILESGGLDKIATVGDKVLGKSIQAIIDFGSSAQKYIKPAIAFFKENAQSIKTVGMALSSLFVIKKITGLVKGLFLLLRANPIGLAITGITILADKLIGLDKIFSFVKNGFKSLTMMFQGQTSQPLDLMAKMGINSDTAVKIYQTIQKIKTGFGVLKQAFGAVGMMLQGQTSQPLNILAKLGISPEVSVHIYKFINGVKNVFTSLPELISKAYNFIQPAVQTIIGLFKTIGGVISTVINTVVVPLIPVFKDIISTAFNIISPIIRVAVSLFKIIGSTVMFLVNSIIKPLIPLIAPIFKGMWDFVKPILNYIIKVFNAIADAIEWAIDKFKVFASSLKKFKMPKIGFPKWMGGNGFIQTDGSHATGLYSVPKDNYVAILHSREAVLTAKQSDALRQAGILKNSGGKPVLDLGSPLSSGMNSQGGVSVGDIKIYVTETANSKQTGIDVRAELEDFFGSLMRRSPQVTEG